MRTARPLAFDLSGVPIRVTGLPGAMGERLAREWSSFASAGPVEPFLDASVSFADRPALPRAFDPKGMRASLTLERARYEVPEGEVVVEASGSASIALASGLDPGVGYFTLLNLLRASLAWRLPSRGGALVHAAGIVLDGRAFLLVGAAGSGKSTFAALAESAGARILSDDLVLIDGAGGTIEALGAPTRSTHRSISGPGRWPLAAVLLPAHGTAARLDPVSELTAHGSLAANLPFVAEALGADPRLDAVVDRLVREVATLRLTFARDDAFVALLRWVGT